MNEKITCSFDHCPIAAGVRQVVDLFGDLTKALRTLRRDLIACARCAQFDHCSLQSAFQADVTATINQVMEEWDLPAAGAAADRGENDNG
jgi:hypothetical protein